MAKERNVEGILNGLANLVEKLGDLADKGEKLKRTAGEFDVGRHGRGLYEVNIKTGLGEGHAAAAKPAPRSAPVHETREPLTDVFDEGAQILIVAEMPGIGVDDVRVAIRDDLLEFEAEHGPKRYRKELLLPAACAGTADIRCNNGIVEIRCTKR